MSENSYIIKGKEMILKLKRLGLANGNENELELPLIQAAYLAEKGVIDHDPKKLLQSAKKINKKAPSAYSVLRYFYDKGYVTRASLDNFDYLRVYQKGVRIDQDRAKYLVRVVEEKEKVSLAGINEYLGLAKKLRKNLVLAILGNDGAIEFISINTGSFQ